MSKAKYYIYRNLNKGKLFSVKYKGKVIDRFENAHAFFVEFRVSKAGRKRCLKQKKRNVHAFAACENYWKHEIPCKPNIDASDKISYNPYKSASFMLDGKPLNDMLRGVYFCDGNCYSIHKYLG